MRPLAFAAFLLLATGTAMGAAAPRDAEPEPAQPPCGATTLVGAPMGTPPPIPLPCSGIRPGARFGFGCTANWVFENTTNGDRDLFIGTAGHCTRLGERVSIGGHASVGTTVFDNDRSGQDFALIRIDEEDEPLVNPALCHWGGPVKSYAHGTLLEQRGERTYLTFGHGVWWFGQPLLQAKRGVRLSLDGGVSFLGPAAPGDSGSPVMLTNGLAWGILTHALHVGTPSAYGYGTPVDYARVDASRALGIQLSLVTAPLA